MRHKESVKNGYLAGLKHSGNGRSGYNGPRMEPRRFIATQSGYAWRWRTTVRLDPALKESPMPWYAWLILIVAIGSIVGGLMMLRDTANKVELTDEQRKRVAERNAEMDAKDAQDR